MTSSSDPAELRDLAGSTEPRTLLRLGEILQSQVGDKRPDGDTGSFITGRARLAW